MNDPGLCCLIYMIISESFQRSDVLKMLHNVDIKKIQDKTEM